MVKNPRGKRRARGLQNRAIDAKKGRLEFAPTLDVRPWPGPSLKVTRGILFASPKLADVAELADALDSGSSGRKVVEVQVLSSALITCTP